MRFKHFLAGLTACLLALSLIGCSSPADTPGPTEPPVLAKIGLCLRQQSDDPEYYSQLEQLLTDAGYSVTVKDSFGDQSKQLTLINDLKNLGMDILVVEPVMVSAAQELTDALVANQIPTIVLDRPLPQELLDQWDQLCYLGSDPAQPGQVQAQIFSQLPFGGDMNGDGVICCAIMNGPEDHADALLRSQSLQMALEGQTVECLVSQCCPWATDQSRAQCAKLLSAYGRDIEVILCADESLAIGAAEAVKNGGWVCGQDICVVGIGQNTAIRNSIRQGMVTATAGVDLTAKHQRLLELCRDLCADTPVEKTNLIDYIPITQKNLP